MIKVIRKIFSICLVSILLISESAASPIWTTSFGSGGSGPGQFTYPNGIAIDPLSGKIYVADLGNNRIQYFNPDTSWANEFGSVGSAINQFSSPAGVFIDRDGKIYVADRDNNRIQTFNNDTSWASEFNSFDSGVNTFAGPTGIAIDTNGRIYVADASNNRIQYFNPGTSSSGMFGTAGSGIGQFGSGFAIAIDSNNKIWVADSYNDRIEIFNPDTSYSSQFGSTGSGNSQFNFPFGIAIDANDKIYVADNFNNRLQTFNSNTSYSSQFGSAGSGINQFNYAYVVALDALGKIYVLDWNNNRIAVLFDPTLWTAAGTTTLGTLTLNQDLTLNNSYNLELQQVTDVTTGSPLTSNGKLTLNSTKTLTMNSGSSLSAVEFDLNGNLAVNQNMTLSMPITLGANHSLNVSSGNTLTLDSNAIVTGSTDLIKNGLGTLDISVANYIGNTNLNSGSIVLRNANLNGDITIAANSVLQGNGSMLGDLINNGIVSPGFSPSFSNGVISATNYIGSPGSSVQLAITAAPNPVAGADYSQITVVNTASLTDSNLIVNADNGSYTDGSRYDLVTAGTVNGEFNNFTLNITGPYEGHLTYDPNLVSLLVTRIYTPPLPNDTSLSTKHASDLSSYIDSLTNMSTDLRQVLDVLYELDETQLDNALRSMTTNRNLTADYVGQDATSLIHAMNNARLSMASDSFIIDNQAGFTSNDKQDNLVSSSTKSNLISSITSNLGTNLINSDQDHIWAAPFAHFARRDTTNRGRGYNSKTGGMILGYDHKFSPSLIGGISLGYYQANFEHHDHGGKDNKVKTTFVAAYGGKKLGQAYLNGSLFAGYNNNLKRQINIPSLATRYARSKHDSYTLSPRLELGYNIKEHSGYQITPFIATEYTSNFAKSYTEKDAESLNMKVKKAENRSFNNELGIKLRKAIKLENDEELALQTKLSYINKKRFKKHNKIKTGFADQNSTYSSDNYSKIEHQISPGFELELVKENGLTIGGSYNGEFSKSYHAHEGMLKMGMNF